MFDLNCILPCFSDKDGKTLQCCFNHTSFQFPTSFRHQQIIFTEQGSGAVVIFIFETCHFHNFTTAKSELSSPHFIFSSLGIYVSTVDDLESVMVCIKMWQVARTLQLRCLWWDTCTLIWLFLLNYCVAFINPLQFEFFCMTFVGVNTVCDIGNSVTWWASQSKCDKKIPEYVIVIGPCNPRLWINLKGNFFFFFFPSQTYIL